MNISQKRAKLTCAIFGFLFIFLLAYLLIVGPNAYLSNKVHFAINSAVLALSLAGYGIVLLKTNKKENIVDERDYFVQKRSYGAGLVITLLYVFSLSIILFISNRQIGTVSVTWLWYIGYSTFAFSYFITSLIILYYYNRE